jgi:hypothetical protein
VIIDLAPLATLYDVALGDELPFPIDLAALYGPLRLPRPKARPCVIGHFVTTRDGVVSLNALGQMGSTCLRGFRSKLSKTLAQCSLDP